VTSTRNAAVEYAARGWSVVPLHSLRDARCTCGNPDCPSPGKHPRVRWDDYQTRPATRTEVIDWWRRWPDANVGIVTGAVSGIVVLDVDPRHGGDRSLADLAARGGELPSAPRGETGGGGVHHYFAAPQTPAASGPVAAGLDLRADGGIVVAPPSVHGSGRQYRWSPGLGLDEVSLAAPPDWLVATGSRVPAHHSSSSPRASAPRTAPERAEFARLWAAMGMELEPGDRYYHCPFHHDAHPSLHVDAAGCRWYCFGCNRGGGPARLRALVAARAKAGAVHPRPASESAQALWPRPLLPAAEPPEFVVPATWLQWPTLQPGGEQPVAGESAYADALEAIAEARTWGGVKRRLVTAQLVREPDNRYDTDAVRVDVGGCTVGYLPRAAAPRFHAILGRLAEAHRAATARARLTGGWERGPAGRGTIGIVLDIDPRISLLAPNCPFLPGDVAVAVSREERHQHDLEEFVRTAPGTTLSAMLGVTDRDATVVVSIAGREVGVLTPATSRRYLPVIREVEAAGFTASCDALVTRGRNKLEVRVLLPRPADVNPD